MPQAPPKQPGRERGKRQEPLARQQAQQGLLQPERQERQAQGPERQQALRRPGPPELRASEWASAAAKRQQSRQDGG